MDPGGSSLPRGLRVAFAGVCGNGGLWSHLQGAVGHNVEATALEVGVCGKSSYAGQLVKGLFLELLDGRSFTIPPPPSGQ